MFLLENITVVMIKINSMEYNMHSLKGMHVNITPNGREKGLP